MNFVAWVDRSSLLGLFLITLVVVFVSIGTGTALRRLMGVRASESDATGSVVGATLGLLAFILAFSFSMAANRYDARKGLLLQEINAIDTTYLRAGLLDDRYRDLVRRQLADYVALRVKAVQQADTLAEAIGASEAIQQRLWAMVETMSREQTLTHAENLFIQSLNEMIDLQSMRVVVGLQYRIPSTIWFSLYVIAVLAMLAVGFQFGQASRRQYVVNVMLGAAFSAVITLIADLDRAGEGTVQVAQQPLLELHEKMKSRQATDSLVPLD